MRLSSSFVCLSLLSLGVAAGCTAASEPTSSATNDATSAPRHDATGGPAAPSASSSAPAPAPAPSSSTGSGVASGPTSLVLYGGHFETPQTFTSDPPSDYLADAWTWDGSAWKKTTGATPGVRSMAAIANVGAFAVLYGGEGGDPDIGRTTLADTWLWNGSAWSASAAKGGPDPMAGPTAVTCNGKLVLFGGYDMTGSSRFDTWTFDGTTWTEFKSKGSSFQAPPSGPQNALGTVAASVNGTCYLIDLDAKMYTWSGASWDSVAQGSVVPPARRFATATTHGATLVLFGGQAEDNGALADTWIWNGTSWTRSNAPGPSARMDAAMASFGSTAVLFGGLAPGVDPDAAPTYFGDTWTWDGASWTERAAPGPHPRADAAMVGR